MREGSTFTQLTLISKKAHPHTKANIRPIALCNVLCKILAKALENITKPLLDDIISEYHSAFIPGIMISNNTIVAYETQHYIERKKARERGICGCKGGYE